MTKRFLLFLLCCLSSFAFAGERDYKSQLDNIIKASKKYEQIKEKDIAKLRSNYFSATGLQDKWKSCKALFDAYCSYQYDSAYAYSKREIDIAHVMNDHSTIIIAACDKVFCLISAGLYKEASDELRMISPQGLSGEAKIRYYMTVWRLYADMHDYVKTEPYQSLYLAKARAYIDSAETCVGKGSWRYDCMESMQLMKEVKTKQAVPILKKLLASKNLDDHLKAITASNLAWAYRTDNQKDKALEYFIISANYDMKAAIKETTAIREAGSMLYEMGDYDEAITCVQKALDDANFYNARQRKIEIGNILPIIQRERYNNMAKQRNTMILTTCIVSLMFIALCISLFFLYRKIKEVQKARRTISERNKQLEKSVEAIHEADKIKTEYIGLSLTTNADYINMMEKLYRTLDNKIMARQYDSLSQTLQESKLNAQRKSMYSNFDEAFLNIFPHFVEKYNALFAPENRKEPEKGQKLTTEMRIFALIRLGVTDSDRIASFLHYSVNTINTYKTRVKNKSLVSNEEFEEKIMAIN